MSFNLVENSWIKVRGLDGGSSELGLRGLLLRAHEIEGLVDDSPLCWAAELRLLVALAHRVMNGPKDDSDWEKAWQTVRFDASAVDAYLARWRERFELLDGPLPFYQTRLVATGAEPNEAAKLGLELPSTGNGALLFNHRLEVSFSPAEAARQLIAHQVFSFGGLMTPWPGHPETKSGNADAPMARAAHVFLRGRNLFETILLNMVCYDPDFDKPHGTAAGDCPAWERPTGMTARQRRTPTGLLDLLTWQSRAIELVPEQVDGKVHISRAVILGGDCLAPGYSLYQSDTEPFAAYRKLNKDDTYVPIALDPDRVVWRQGLALLASGASKLPFRHPSVLEARAQRIKSSDIDLSDLSLVAPLDIIGTASEAPNSKVKMWRHEQLFLPMALLLDRDLLEDVHIALDKAEKAGRALSSSYTWGALAHKGPDGKPDERDAKRLASAYACPETYWASLDLAFRQFLLALPANSSEAGAAWEQAVHDVACRSFERSMTSFDQGQYLVAKAQAESNFRWKLFAAIHPERVSVPKTKPKGSRNV